MPDVENIVEKLSGLIENPKKIEKIGSNARQFINREHDYIKIASRYIDIWGK